MWADPSRMPAREPLPLRFVLVGEGPHALSPGLGVGPTLCGEEEPAPGRALSAGFTSVDLDRVGCDGCCGVACRMVEAIREARLDVTSVPATLGGRAPARSPLPVLTPIPPEGPRRTTVNLPARVWDKAALPAVDIAAHSPIATLPLGRRAGDRVHVELGPDVEPLVLSVLRVG